ncbi:MAG TPA: acyl-CoA synthetase FdrA [Actinomycetota bacterium]|nr:acyl-CoA synthetase FdrA [Actinomycetota bacterium]
MTPGGEGAAGRVLVHRGAYHDSIALMLASKRAEEVQGVRHAFCFMATPLNLDLVARQGVHVADDVGPNDLVIAFVADSEAALDEAERAVVGQLSPGGDPSPRADAPPRSLRSAARRHPELDVAFVSVPGRHAAYECAQALEAGLHVFCFSDGVGVEAEAALKRRAVDAGLLMMGPDCGTSILDGAGFGFANAVARGPIGIVGASGTGIQELSCLLDAAAVGISQAIGVGGRDLSSEVGGVMTRRALDILAADDATEVIVVVSKPPSPEVAAAVEEAARTCGKPFVPGFLGNRPGALEDAARRAVQLAGARVEQRRIEQRAVAPGWIRGLFCGGTLCSEASAIVAASVGGVASNVDLDARGELWDGERGEGHTFVDFGADEFTQGRAHPMIDPTLRNERLAREARDPSVAVVLADVVLGFGAHPDPAGDLAPLIEAARRERGAELAIIVSLCGTYADPQDLGAQAAALEAAGAVVTRSSAQAARRALVAIGASDDAGTDPWQGTGASRARATVGSSAVFGGTARVANAGVDVFADTLAAQGATVVRVKWRPGAPGTEAALAALALHSDAIAAANDRAVAGMQAARPFLAGVGRADALIEDLDRRTFLHAGPPIEWAAMSGPLRGAIAGAAVLEGVAADPAEAAARAERGEFRFLPCHERGAVGPMAGVVSASMPMWVVVDESGAGRGYATFNEGLGKVLRYGANDDEVLTRLRWMRDVMAPVMASALEASGPVDLRTMIAQALQMGDEAHNRNRAGTSLFLRALLPALLELDRSSSEVAAVVRFIAGNDHFFLNLSMPAAKVTADAGAGVPRSSIVTAMARNGTEFGVRLSGTGDRWFTGPAGTVDGLFLPGFGPEDANPDIGDSTITETVGLGGFAMAAAPAIVRFVGGTADDALAATQAMYEIAWAESEAYQVPALGFRGTPLGIDAREVVHTGVLPAVNTGIAHREPGVGQVGAGLVEPPMQAFSEAVGALASSLSRPQERGTR